MNQTITSRERAIAAHLDAMTEWHAAMARIAAARRELADAEAAVQRASNVLDAARKTVESVLAKPA